MLKKQINPKRNKEQGNSVKEHVHALGMETRWRISFSIAGVATNTVLDMSEYPTPRHV